MKTALSQPPAVPAAPPRLPVVDRIALRVLQVYGAVALLALALVPLHFLPAEDAVILFQYSRNLAQHGAITFLAGGPHVEGATDFGWMVLIAAAFRCGIAPFVFCAAANVVSLAALGAVLLRMAGRRITPGGLLAVAGAAALFRQIFAAASGFSVLPDAFLLALLTLYVLRQRAAAAAVTAIGLCLLRPDGVIFALPLLALTILQSRTRARAALLATALFVLPGVLYFLWRWHYFGELFPLPFLVKTDFRRELGFLIAGSVRASLVPLLFTLTAAAPVFALRRRVNLLLALALIAIPTLFFWTIRLDQNVGSRFFYYLPVAAAILLAANWQALSPRPALAFRTAFLAWLLLLSSALYRELLTFRSMQFPRVQAIAEQLGRLPRHGSILGSEAGFVPYYSGWPTTDPWGLNTPEFAHRFFQPADVARIAADLIVMHPDLPESCIVQPNWKAAYPDRSWPHMTRNLIIGAQAAGYELWLTSYGSEFYRLRKHWGYGEGDRECWLIKQDSPLRPQIEQILLAHHGVPPEQAVELERRRATPTR